MKTAPDNTYRRLFMNAFEEDINSSFAYLNNVNYTKNKCGYFKQNCVDSRPYIMVFKVVDGYGNSVAAAPYEKNYKKNFK